MTTTAATTSTPTTPTTTQSLGASIISSLGSGSGVDTDTLVTQLTAAQKTSLEGAITTKQTANTAQISSAASIASELTTFSANLATLVSGGTLMSTPTSSDKTVATATAIPGSRLGNLNSTITVTSIATAQALQSGDLSGFSTTGGTLTVKTAGGSSTPVTIAAGASISDVATAINAAKSGVTASVVSSGGKSTLVLKGTTGASNAFSITTSGDGALGALAYNDGGASTAADGSTPATSTMASSAAAADAVLNVDGVDVTSASNTLTNVVAGVSVTIAKAGTVSLTGTRPTDAITQALNAYVSDYNQLKSDLDAATAAAINGGSAGPLRGESTIRTIQRQLTQLTTTRLTATGSVTTLAQIGVKTAQDGTLSVDADTLSNMLTKYPDDVEAMFNPVQSSSSSAVSINSTVGTVAAGVYSLTGLTALNGTTYASGSIDGVAATGSGSTLTAATGSPAAGLVVSLSNSMTVPSSATLTIDQGLSGALTLITNALTYDDKNNDDNDGLLTSLQDRLSKQTKTLADALTAADAQVTVYHDRLVSQFSTMNTRVSAYKATGSYLTQQVDLWTKPTS